MASLISQEDTQQYISIIPVGMLEYDDWYKQQPAMHQQWLSTCNFIARPGTFCRLPAKDGSLGAVVVGVPESPTPWDLAMLPEQLPAGRYCIDSSSSVHTLELWGLGWLLACYQFDRYRESEPFPVTLALPEDCAIANVQQLAEAIYRVRDLVNTPANDMGPRQLEQEAQKLAKQFDAHISVISGDALLTHNYPAIHAVGRAAVQSPRLIDLRWGKPNHPKVTLVGKGVCFDSGGLDLKSASGMRLMKKDMGGAAHVLALAQLVMQRHIPVQLRVLIPAVENSVNGNAYRPSDILRSRKGISIEIENTDAEGRLILCDALTEAEEEKPDLLIDFATLTGAARVALGTEIPAFFCRQQGLAEQLQSISWKLGDPLWQLPLFTGYRNMLDSRIADISNAASGGYGGAITAALFLSEFVDPGTAWLHVDLMAWNTSARPGRPEGGEAMGLRSVLALLEQRYGHD